MSQKSIYCVCPVCAGSGSVSHMEQTVQCHHCDGEGHVYWGYMEMPE